MGYWSLLCCAAAMMNFACGLPVLGIVLATLGLILGMVDLVSGPEDEDESEEIDRRKVNENILAALKAAK